MFADYYYARLDEHGVLCVDQLGDGRPTWTTEEVAKLAESYPDTIYFQVIGEVS